MSCAPFHLSDLSNPDGKTGAFRTREIPETSVLPSGVSLVEAFSGKGNLLAVRDPGPSCR